MSPFAYIAISALCTGIAVQDLSQRMVHWFLFPLLGLVLAWQHYLHVGFQPFLASVILNLILVNLVLGALFAYTRYIMKKKFLNTSFGAGDLLFFYAFALGYPTYTFLLLFTGAILFSALVYFIMIKRGDNTVPLAGLMGIFVMGATLASLWPNAPSLYLM
ncbi:MAG: hypothetical protein AB3N16_09755 [Flavobacteriaceae bacterium]